MKNIKKAVRFYNPHVVPLSAYRPIVLLSVSPAGLCRKCWEMSSDVSALSA